MNSDRAATLMLIAVCAGTLSACDDGHHYAGPVGAQTRDVQPFDSIDMQGSARLEIKVGKPESLRIEGRRSVIERVTAEVRGNTLYIESKPKDWFMSNNRRRITLKISVPRLHSLQVEGGNDVRLSGFAGGESSIRAAGAAHIRAKGHLEQLTVRMAGAGHGDFSKLIANDAKVTVDGVGSVIVHPKDTLDATMNGVGAILYTGNPHAVNTRMNGLGTIGRRDAGDDDDDDEEDEDSDQADSKVDPDSLQPEYAAPKQKKTASPTEVI